MSGYMKHSKGRVIVNQEMVRPIHPHVSNSVMNQQTDQIQQLLYVYCYMQQVLKLRNSNVKNQGDHIKATRPAGFRLAVTIP